MRQQLKAARPGASLVHAGQRDFFPGNKCSLPGQHHGALASRTKFLKGTGSYSDIYFVGWAAVICHMYGDIKPFMCLATTWNNYLVNYGVPARPLMSNTMGNYPSSEMFHKGSVVFRHQAPQPVHGSLRAGRGRQPVCPQLCMVRHARQPQCQRQRRLCRWTRRELEDGVWQPQALRQRLAAAKRTLRLRSARALGSVRPLEQVSKDEPVGAGASKFSAPAAQQSPRNARRGFRLAVSVISTSRCFSCGVLFSPAWP